MKIVKNLELVEEILMKEQLGLKYDDLSEEKLIEILSKTPRIKIIYRKERGFSTEFDKYASHYLSITEEQIFNNNKESFNCDISDIVDEYGGFSAQFVDKEEIENFFKKYKLNSDNYNNSDEAIEAIMGVIEQDFIDKDTIIIEGYAYIKGVHISF